MSHSFKLMILIIAIAVIVAIVIDWPRQGAKGGSRLANTLKVGLNVVWIVLDQRLVQA